ncbi:MAG: hypothetical protein JW728_05760 [Candidatus Aureabacteria bacterium]|nr:hypothetical protein [Candidatus Auribacterota bacterium]
MKKSVYAKCPVCGSMLEVKTENGSIIRHFKPKEHKESEDSLLTALKDLKDRETKLEDAFSKGKNAEKSKPDRLEKLFNEEKEKARKEKDIKPGLREIDLD